MSTTNFRPDPSPASGPAADRLAGGDPDALLRDLFGHDLPAPPGGSPVAPVLRVKGVRETMHATRTTCEQRWFLELAWTDGRRDGPAITIEVPEEAFRLAQAALLRGLFRAGGPL